MKAIIVLKMFLCLC